MGVPGWRRVAVPVTGSALYWLLARAVAQPGDTPGMHVQIASIGIAILIDRRERPVFPRWAGYFNLWVALLISPAGVVVFFKQGPFSWNGIVGFFTPLVAFAGWIAVMTAVLLRRSRPTRSTTTRQAAVRA